MIAPVISVVAARDKSGEMMLVTLEVPREFVDDYVIAKGSLFDLETREPPAKRRRSKKRRTVR